MYSSVVKRMLVPPAAFIASTISFERAKGTAESSVP